jgi:glycosyltransferase involved in cell wall biosynthesis
MRPSGRYLSAHQGTTVRILHAYKVYRPDIEGGIPAVMSSLAQNSDPDVQHAILTARRFGLARRYQLDDVPVQAVASLGTLFSTPLAPGYIPALIGRARSADIMIHHAPLPLNDAAILLGLPDHVPLIVYWHADIVGYALLKRLVTPLLRRVLARADRIVVSGQPMIDHSDFLRPHSAKCTVLPYGTDLLYWRALDPAERVKVEEMKRARPRHIVSVGRLVSYKGYEVLLRAMREIDGCATIVGEGPRRTDLQRQASESGIGDRVHFAGRLGRSEIKQLFHAAQVFAFPSVTEAEAFGIVQIEAMAAGLPIVNTNLATTVPSIARHEREGLTIPPNDPHALALALSRILNESELRQRLGAAAKIRADDFDQSIFHAGMARVFDAAIRKRRETTGK